MPNEYLSDPDAFKAHFDSRQYLQTYYPPLSFEEAWIIFQKIGLQAQMEIDINVVHNETGISHEVLENISIIAFQRQVTRELARAYPDGGATILDVGAGPTIYQHATNALVGTITHAEYLKANRDEVELWRQNKAGAYDWSSYLLLTQSVLLTDPEYQTQIEQNRQSDDQTIADHATEVRRVLDGSVEDYAGFIQSRITEVIPCDVFEENLGISGIEQVDIITSNFCVESATRDKSRWQKGMLNIMRKVKSGGYLLISAIRNADWYRSGDETLPAVSVDENDLKKIIGLNGFEVVYEQVLVGSDKGDVGYDGMVFLLAKKH